MGDERDGEQKDCGGRSGFAHGCCLRFVGRFVKRRRRSNLLLIIFCEVDGLTGPLTTRKSIRLMAVCVFVSVGIAWLFWLEVHRDTGGEKPSIAGRQRVYVQGKIGTSDLADILRIVSNMTSNRVLFLTVWDGSNINVVTAYSEVEHRHSGFAGEMLEFSHSGGNWELVRRGPWDR